MTEPKRIFKDFQRFAIYEYHEIRERQREREKKKIKKQAKRVGRRKKNRNPSFMLFYEWTVKRFRVVAQPGG